MAFKRKHLSKSKSKRSFRKGAHTHVRNLQTGNPMRGGIRL